MIIKLTEKGKKLAEELNKFSAEEIAEGIAFVECFGPLEGTHDFQCYHCRDLFPTLTSFSEHLPCSKANGENERLRAVKRQ